jgi:RNA polymerase sigma factor (sigma-70 family)
VSNGRNGRRLQEWVERWNGQLTRFLRRRVSASVDAEDLAQEVYLRLLRIDHLEQIEEPQAYLYHVARNTAAEWRERAQQSRPHSAEELDALIELTTPENLLEEAAEQQQLDAALRTLPAHIRAVLYLKLRDGKTHEEIALHLGISSRMVRKHLTTGYGALRRRLIREADK